MIEAVKEEVDRYPELGTQHQESQPCPKKLKTVVALHETKSVQPDPAAGTQDSDSDTYLEWMKRSSIHHLQGKRKL